MDFGVGSDVAVKLIETTAGVGLAFQETKLGKPYFVDFQSVSWRARFQKGLPRNHIFRRALGAMGQPLKLVDATAGFGQDAVMAQTLGCDVTALERSPEVARVLQDGLKRAAEDELLRSKLKHIRVVQADALEWLEKLAPADAPDVIYIDPMFDKPKKSAKSPKEMQLLQALLPPVVPGEEEKLLELAIQVARQRAVVKRPLKTRAVLRAPTHSFKGQSVRYDVYMK